MDLAPLVFFFSVRYEVLCRFGDSGRYQVQDCQPEIRMEARSYGAETAGLAVVEAVHVNAAHVLVRCVCVHGISHPSIRLAISQRQHQQQPGAPLDTVLMLVIHMAARSTSQPQPGNWPYGLTPPM